MHEEGAVYGEHQEEQGEIDHGEVEGGHGLGAFGFEVEFDIVVEEGGWMNGMG